MNCGAHMSDFRNVPIVNKKNHSDTGDGGEVVPLFVVPSVLGRDRVLL